MKTNGLNSSSSILAPWLVNYFPHFMKRLSWPLWNDTTSPTLNSNPLHPLTYNHFQQCIIHFCVCVRPASCLSGDESDLLRSRDTLADKTLLKMTGRGNNPISQKAPIPWTPQPSTPLPPHSRGLPTAGPQWKQHCLPNWLFITIFIVVSKVCSSRSFYCSYHDMV